MKPFLIRLGLLGSVQLAIAGFVLIEGNPRDENHFYCAMTDKLERMDETEGPRLLLVGGSNVAFGIDSEEFEENGLVPINLGLHAGLGLEFYLKILEERIREGDTIVLMPEYELLTTEPGSAMQREMLAVCPEFSRYFNLSPRKRETWKHQLDHQALPAIHAWVKRAFRGKRIADEGIYRRNAFNRYGDMVAHLEGVCPSVDFPCPPLTFDPALAEKSIGRLNEFARHCRDRGADVYFSFPPMPKERYESSQAALRQLQALLDRELQIPQIDRPSDYVFPKEQFFDTYYHLTAEAIVRRTRHLRQSLQLHKIARRSRNSSALR